MKKKTFKGGGLVAILVSLVSLCSCEKPDVGMFGSIYVRSDAPYREFSTLARLSKEREKYILLVEQEDPHPTEFLVKDGHLYVLHSYGDEDANQVFFYPDKTTLNKIRVSNIKGLGGGPCLGIRWLRSDAPMQVSKKEDGEIYFFEDGYRKNVKKTVGKFCDQ